MRRRFDFPLAIPLIWWFHHLSTLARRLWNGLRKETPKDEYYRTYRETLG